MSLTMRYAHEFGMCTCVCVWERARTRLFTHESRTKTRLNWHCLLLILLSSHTRRVPTRTFTQYTSMPSLSCSLSLHLPFSLLHSLLSFRSHFCHPPPSGRMNTNKKKYRKNFRAEKSVTSSNEHLHLSYFRSKSWDAQREWVTETIKTKQSIFFGKTFHCCFAFCCDDDRRIPFIHRQATTPTSLFPVFVSYQIIFDWPENEFTSFLWQWRRRRKNKKRTKRENLLGIS